MTNRSMLQSLLVAVQRYLDLMFDYDVARFDEVFAPSAQLHGLRDGALRVLTARDYRDVLTAGPSPRSRNAPRHEEVLLVDLAAPTQALVKVRVRIDTVQYLDYLSWHCLDGAWLITAKSFQAERRFEPSGG